jgi:hypothetical protein
MNHPHYQSHVLPQPQQQQSFPQPTQQQQISPMSQSGYPGMHSSGLLTYALPPNQQRNAMNNTNGMTNTSNNNNVNGLVSGHAQRKQEERARLQRELEHVLEELELTHVLRQPLADYGVESCHDLLLLEEDPRRCAEFFSKLSFYSVPNTNVNETQLSAPTNSETANGYALPFKPMQWKKLMTLAREKKEMSTARCPNSFICPITQGLLLVFYLFFLLFCDIVKCLDFLLFFLFHVDFASHLPYYSSG